MAALEIAGRPVGNGHPVYVIAEAGVNHCGELKTALELVDAAVEAGADAVKFQTFDVDELVSDHTPLAGYQRKRSAAANQREMLERLHLEPEDFARLAGRARERGITFLSTPFDAGSARLLAGLGMPAVKIGSGDLTNLPLLELVAGFGVPVLVSTGMADMAEIDAAVRAVEAQGAMLGLLHCVSSYPVPPDQANLRAMDTLREAYPHLPIGYSDHCMGLEVSLAAVARGAAVLERHLTLDRTRHGPDHEVSLEPDELAQLVRSVRIVERALGTGRKEPQPAEIDVRDVARRSIVAARAIGKGEVLDATTLAIKRPGGGMSPAELGMVTGRIAARDIAADEQLTPQDFR